MELEVYWLDRAVDRLHDIYSYYALKAGERVAGKLVEGIIDSTLRLKVQPEMGQIEEALADRAEGFRYLVFKNYKIVYRINMQHKRVEIALVFDTRQNPTKMREVQ